MKKVQDSILIIAVAVFSFSCNTNTSSVHVVGEIEGLGDSEVLVGKVGSYSMNISIIDTIECRSNFFDQTLAIKKSDSLYCLKANGRYLYFIPNCDTIKIRGSSTALMESKLEGSESNILVSSYWQSFYEVYNQAIPLYMAMNDAKSSNNKELIDSIMQELAPLDSVRKYLPSQFIDENPNNLGSSVILYLSLPDYQTRIAELEAMFGKLDKTVQNSPVGSNLEKHLSSLNATSIGKPFVNLELANPVGETLAIESLKGNVFLIEFWTTWCGPCRAELPNLRKAYQMYNEHGFDIISISLDESSERWKKAIKEMNTPWPQTILKESDEFSTIFEPFESNAANSYAVLNVPASFLVDKDGLIIGKNLRGRRLLEKLAEIYGNKDDSL